MIIGSGLIATAFQNFKNENYIIFASGVSNSLENSQIEFNSIENFENYLKENDLNIKLIREKFAIELIWNDLVFQKYNSKISIDKQKIKSEILNKPKKNLRELSISEIIFNCFESRNFTISLLSEIPGLFITKSTFSVLAFSCEFSSKLIDE